MGFFCATPTIVGDINADGYVNVGDLQRLTATWASQIDEPGYSPEADLNSDGYINVGDLQVLISNWNAS